MSKISTFKSYLLCFFLFICYLTQSAYSQSLEEFKLGSIGIAYGSVSMSNGDLKSILDGSPGRLMMDITGYQGNLGFKIYAWAINQGLIYSLGTFEESGGAICFTPNLHFGGESLKMIFYFDVGVGYQKTKISINNFSTNYYGYSAQNSGFALVYGGGAELLLFNKLIIFSDYKMIKSNAGDLDVGNAGVAFGLKWAFSEIE